MFLYKGMLDTTIRQILRWNMMMMMLIMTLKKTLT